MKYLLVYLVCCSSLVFASNGEFSYQDAQLMRLHSYQNYTNWLTSDLNKESSNKKSNITVELSYTKDFQNTLNDFTSKNNDLITSRINRMYGAPQSLSFLGAAKYSSEWFSQSIYYIVGANARVNSPVFPKADLFFQNDVGTKSNYIYLQNKNDWFGYRMNLSANYGVRKILNESFTAAQFLAKEVDLKLSNRPWSFYTDLSFDGRIDYQDYSLFYSAINIPIINKEKASYYETRLGISYLLDFDNAYQIKPSISYSPLYGGKYDVSRTMIGKLDFDSSYVDFSWWIQQNSFFNIQFIIKFAQQYNVSFGTNLNIYDDYAFEKNRQYHAELGYEF